MSFFVPVFAVILTLYQIGRNPASGEWTFLFFLYFEKVGPQCVMLLK